MTEKLNSFNSLNIGDNGITKDNIEITFTEYKLVDYFEYRDGQARFYPPEGAKFLIAYLKVTNVGSVKTPSDTILFGLSPKDTPRLLYAGTEITSNDFVEGTGSTMYANFLYLDDFHNPKFKGYGSAYPNVTKEGWIAFLVPSNIQLSEAQLEVHGLRWSF